jgi:hypothetical protein
MIAARPILKPVIALFFPTIRIIWRSMIQMISEKTAPTASCDQKFSILK